MITTAFVGDGVRGTPNGKLSPIKIDGLPRYAPFLDRLFGTLVMDRIRALSLLSECTGDDIWSLEHCRLRRLPDAWVEELRDCFESNPQVERQTIYVDRERVNQYEGIRDVDLAIKLAEYLGVDTNRLIDVALSRADLVHRIREALMDE